MQVVKMSPADSTLTCHECGQRVRKVGRFIHQDGVVVAVLDLCESCLYHGADTLRVNG